MSAPQAGPAGAPYEPPKQSVRGQLVDSVIILLLLFVVLFGVTYYTESSGSSASGKTVALSELPLTPDERTQYQKLIDDDLVDLETVNEQVMSQLPSDDKYPIGLGAALLTFGVIGAYLLFIYGMSFKQYREVIGERFGPAGADGAPPGDDLSTPRPEVQR